MTEIEWLASNDPAAMLRYLNSFSVSDRKWRLFAQHIAFPHLGEVTRGGYPNEFPDGWLRGLLGAATAGKYGAKEAAILRDIIGNPFRRIGICKGGHLAGECRLGLPDNQLTPTVLALARTIDEGKECEACGGEGKYDVDNVATTRYLKMTCRVCHGTGRQPAWDTMGPLWDALETAGCDNESIRAHCLGPFHVRGCWVIDFILGNN